VGKTTFLTQLIAEFKARGYRVAVIKHHAGAGLEIDLPGKDSWHHFQAGADTVVIAAPDRMAIHFRPPRDLTLDELVDLLPTPVDLALTEGYKRGPTPAIEVARAACGQELVGDLTRLIALVTDMRLTPAVPHFALDDASGVADFLETRFTLVPATAGTQPPVER
jgi:molybdopterin-guanine dinucleotide biosynthesis protein MobB